MAIESISSVKQGRLQRGLTLRDLAEKCSQEGTPIGTPQLSKIERGLHTPRPRLRAVLARLLDIDIAELQQAPEQRTTRQLLDAA